MKRILTFVTAFCVLAACTAAPRQRADTGSSAAATVAAPTSTASESSALSEEEAATLGSLELVDGYPLYTMRYSGTYSGVGDAVPAAIAAEGLAPEQGCHEAWGCSLFAALGDENDRVLGRNFDWSLSPALLLFAKPPDGYASISMVDMEYLGFTGERSKNLMALSLEERKPLLDAPLLPFDGMNEAGIAVGMAAVPPGNVPSDPQKRTIGELRAIREMLDHAGTVDEAIEILSTYNIDMSSVPIHYLIGSAAGESAVVEFYDGKMVVMRNEARWQTATNFLVASTNGEPQGQCWRYDRMNQELAVLQGRITAPEALRLLGDVSQDNTQWTMVYHMTSGDVEVVMGRAYERAAHTFRLDRSQE